MVDEREICGHIGGDREGAIRTVCNQPKGHIGKHGGMGCEWDSGATPGRIPGDKGQRYEVYVYPNSFDADTQGMRELIKGWHDTEEGAVRMAESLVKHPEALNAWVLDRAAMKRVFECKAERR